jgi:hypothetical protein
MRWGRWMPRGAAVLALAVALLMLPSMTTWAESAQSLCRGDATDDVPQPIPESLVPAAVRLFGLQAMPREQVARSTLYRCDEGRVLLCNLGANLPCDKANASRDLPAAEAWCAENPGSDFIPMYITGHDTIYRWRCNGTKAATMGQPLEIDRRGFISRLWKPVDAAAEPRR